MRRCNGTGDLPRVQGADRRFRSSVASIKHACTGVREYCTPAGIRGPPLALAKRSVRRVGGPGDRIECGSRLQIIYSLQDLRTLNVGVQRCRTCEPQSPHLEKRHLFPVILESSVSSGARRPHPNSARKRMKSNLAALKQGA